MSKSLLDAVMEADKEHKDEVAVLKQEIERLRAKMASIISALQEEIGSPQINLAKISLEEKHNKPPAQADTGPTTRTRGIQALDRMPLSGFGTAEWFKSINNDGNSRQVNKNRALRIFKDLMDDGMIEILHERSGKRGGVYKKINKETLAEPSQASGLESL